MPSFTKEELIAASELRTISQRELFHMLEERGKLGVLYKDSLAAVLLPHARYATMATRLKELDETLLQHQHE
ncbi:hypothetical protein [Alicyclobacillus ferrooxydans]|uniref:Uncharacterized protein n=1 Tax=Alicyclobacillus ferrooxydans TaxID=471514 RepID=A0A0P9CSH8_9BACL|nr:hypothetical protein [Alicyclobacillus ferrooxydans]KPV42584.1 hypothetical protein AN477_16450 [Alicyclobacillus ferrooxydans]